MEENKMTICERTRTISLTKKEMTTARRLGTPKYKELQTARRDYPGFTVTTATHKVKTQRETYKGLTYAYMEKYIKTHDDENETIWVEYMKYRGTPIFPEDEMPEPYTYMQMKDWFLGKFEAVAKFYESRN